MSHRFTTWWRALSVVLLSLATVTWPMAARADTTARFTMIHQGAIATLSSHGTTHFSTTLAFSSAKGTIRASVALYPALVTRTQLDAIVSNVGSSAAPLSATGSFSLNCLRRGVATFRVVVFTRTPAPPTRTCSGATPRLHLVCARGSCDGVYPLRYDVNIGGARETKWSLLTIRSNVFARPLQVALIESLTHTTLNHEHRSLQILRALSHFASTPLTLTANYETLSAMEFDTNSSTAWRDALTKALVSPLHRALDAPPSSIDFAGLARLGLTTQVRQQLALSQDLFKSLTGLYVDGPVLLSGHPSPAGLSALANAGVHDVVLPEDDLAQPPSNTLNWGAPFHVPGASSLTALSDDGPLSSLLSDSSIEPGRRAALAIATLAFLHFEAPNAPTSRSVVIDSPVGSTSTTFLADLLSGLRRDPFSQLTTLTPLFDSSLIGADGAPRERPLLDVPVTSTWSSHNVSSLLTLIGAVTSFTQGVKTGDVATALHVAVARSEILANPTQRQDAIDAAAGQLNTQLGQFSIDASAITLAGQGTSLPITVISHADYHVDAVIHLIADGLSFPKGNAVPITLSSPTQSIRVTTAHPRGSSLTLQVVLTTPNDQVVLARSALQVHIAGKSVVGYLLTFASLFVLAWWWWRTNHRRSRGRHAR